MLFFAFIQIKIQMARFILLEIDTDVPVPRSVYNMWGNPLTRQGQN